MGRFPTIAQSFDPRANALNAVRLLLAILVIVWHAFPLSGTEIDYHPVRQLMGEIAVDGFFAVSGFLILRSWRRNPRWGQFLVARTLRIFPAFWVCLVVTAFLIAPLATMISTGQSFGSTISHDNLTYLLNNLALRITQPRIGETPVDVPYGASWNGSLWTLWWEFLCYIGVLVVGILGLYRFRLVVPVLFVIATLALIPTAYGPTDNFFIESAARFGVMFTAGALLFEFADRIPLSSSLVVAAAAVTLATMFLPDYRIVGALPLAYTVFGIGALVKHPRWRFEQDLSYGTYIYAFPLQQLLASARVYEWGLPTYVLLSIALTLGLAALSWFVVERNALKLKPWRRDDKTVRTGAIA